MNPSPRNAPRRRRALLATLAIGGLSIALAARSAALVAAEPPPTADPATKAAATKATATSTTGKFRLTMLELPPFERGGGLAIVMQTPAGHVYLYDTGVGYPLRSNPATLKGLPPATAEQHLVDVKANRWQGDVNHGRDVVLPWLKQHEIAAVDGVVISHAHYDHFGGLLWLVDKFPMGKLMDSGFQFHGETPASHQHIVAELQAYDDLRERFRAKDHYQAATAGTTLNWDPALKVEVIAPPATYFGDPVPESRKPTDPPAHFLVNANSIGLRITHGDVTFSLPGDVQNEDQLHSLLKSVPPEKLRCDVLIAPAHGIHADPEYAAAVHPKVVLCGVFDHFLPTLRAPPTYEALGAEVWINSQHGDLTVESDGKIFTVRHARDGNPKAETPRKKSQ